jgi:hypothetical protein
MFLAANKMRTIKQILLPVCIFFLINFFSSCSRSSNSDSVYYLKASFDGTTKTFNSTVTAQKSQDFTGHYSLTISGLTIATASGTPTSKSEEATLMLWSDQQDFAAGKTFTTVEQQLPLPANIFEWVSEFSGIPDDTWRSSYSFSSVTETFNCTITELTVSYVKGNFSTVIYKGVDSPIVSKTITSGEFYAKFYP